VCSATAVRLLPRAAPVFAADGATTEGSNPSFSPPSLLLFLRQVGGRTGEWFPPRRLGLGDPRGVSSAALIAVGGAGHVDGQDAARGGGAGCAAFALAVSQSGKSRG
jgi:hypothetical protein